jgi:hypothetical protein
VVLRGTSRARHGRITLRLSDLASLRPGRYTLRIAGRRGGTSITVG